MKEAGGWSALARTELFTISRFTLVGIGATSIHIAVVWVLIDRLSVTPLLANSIAFACAFGVSFSGHYLWTFRSSRLWSQAMWRFLFVSVGALTASNITLLLLLASGMMASRFAAVLAACIIPLASYLLGRFWAFQSHG